MADGDKDILQLHFGIDIRDVETKVKGINTALGSIVEKYTEVEEKIREKMKDLFKTGANAASDDAVTTYTTQLNNMGKELNKFRVERSRVLRALNDELASSKQNITDTTASLKNLLELFKDAGFSKEFTNGFRGLVDSQGVFKQFSQGLDNFRIALDNPKGVAVGLDTIANSVSEAVNRIIGNWDNLKSAMSGKRGGVELAELGLDAFKEARDIIQRTAAKNANGGVLPSFDAIFRNSDAINAVSSLFLKIGKEEQRMFNGDNFATALELGLKKSILDGMDTAFGALTVNMTALGRAVQAFPSDSKDKLQNFSNGLEPLVNILKDSEIGMNASSIVDLLNSAGSAVQIDGEQLAKAIQDKMKSVRIPVALKPDPNSITPQVRDEVQTKLNAKPLTIPVEFVFETGAKRVENAAKAAAQATEKSMTFSTELEELKAYREYLNATAIDAATFREKLDSVYENLFPRRNRPSLADNELLPQADKLIAEMEDKAAKLADASAKATARQQLMIGGDAIEAFRVDAQAKLDAMKPLEFTNIKLKASTVDASGIKEAVGLDKLESNAKLLKGIAVPLSKLDVSNAKPVNADILQKNFDAMVNLTIPISRLTFSDDVSKMDTTKLKDNVDTLGNKLVLPIYKADLENVRAIQSGEEVSKKISDLAHLVAYIQSIDLSKAQIENQEGLEAKVKEFANRLKQNFTKMGDELSKEIKIPFLEQKNINRMFAYARAIKTIADSMKYLNGLQETLAKLDSSKLGMARSIANAEAAGNPDPALMMEADKMRAESAERVKERGKTYQEEIDRLKDSIEMQKALQNVSEQAEKASSSLPLGGGKNDTALLAEKSKTLETFNAAIREDIGLQDSLRDRFTNDAELARHFGGSMADAKNRLDAYTESLRKVASMTGSGWLGGMSGEFQSASMEFEKMYRSMGAAKMRFDELVKAVKAGRFDIRGGGMNIAGLDVTALKRLQAEMKTTGDSFTEMMRTMGFYITGRSVITFFQNAIKSASQFSMEIRRIQSLATTFDFDRIKTGLESLDARFGNLIHNAKALYWAFSSGVRGTEEELVRFTETMSKTAITIGSDVMPVMDAATTLMNAYGKSAASAGEISDLLFTIVKEGKANGQQLASSIGNIIAPASAMGLTFKDIGATISTLTRTMKTNNALTYLNNILAKMNNPTKEVQSQLDKLGLEINATAIKAKGFAQVMREIHEATRGDINLIAKIFPDIRGQRAAVTLFSTQFGEFQRQLENFGNMSGNMQEALSKITDNPEAQFAALRNGFEMIRQAAGDAAINVVTLGGALTPIFSAVNGMKSFGRSVAGHIAGLAALGVVMNMLGKARLMLESSNISSIQQMNLAYVEQSKAIGDSVMAMRKQEELNQANRVAVMENWSKQKLANDAEYQSLLNEQKQLEARQSLLNARREEFKVALNIAQADRDALKNAEELALMNRKSELAYEKFSASLTARTGIPNQWGLEDSLSKAGAYIRSFRNETDLKAKTSGLATGDLQAVVDAAVAKAFRDNPNNIDQATVAATVAKMAGVAATDAIKNEVINRRVAEATMQKMLADANDMFKSWVKDGKNPEFLGSLTTKIDALNSVMQQRVQDARAVSISLDDLYLKLSLTTEQRNMLVEIMKEENDVAAKLSGTESALLRIQNEAGGEAYKVQLEAQKALAQSYASENKIHAANIQNIIRETEARVKNAAAQRDAAKAEAEAMRGRQRLNDYIVQNNLQFGKQKTKLDELIQSYRQLAVASSSAFQWKQTPVSLAEQIARQRYLQTGQFNNESGAWRGAWAAAGAAAQNAHISNFLNKLSFLPGVGGMVGMFVRPFSMFYKEFVKLGGVILQGSSAVVKGIAVWRTANAVIGKNIAMGQKLTALQALANTSVSRFAGTIMGLHIGSARTIGQMAALGHAAKMLGISVKGLQTAMWMLAGVGGVAILAISGITAGLVSLTDNGGPLRKLADWMEGLNAIKQRGTALDSIFGMVKDVGTRRNDFEQRRKYLLAELDYRRWTGQVIGETNGVDAMIIRQREQQLRNVKFEKNIESERLSQLSKQYKDVYATAESLFSRYEVTYQDSFLRQLWNVNTTFDWRKLAFPTEMYRIINDMIRMQKASRALRGLDVDIDTERFASQQLVPSAIATLRSHEMLLEMENNTADIMAQEQNNAMRQLALETKRNLTLRRMSILTGGKSPYMKMYEVAKAEETARAKKEAADFKLQKMLENGISADSETYKTQSALAEQLGKELERAENTANNFHTSYVNYRKQQAQQLLEQIKLDREIADMTRKSTYQDLDRQALLGGNYAEAAKLEMQMKDAYKLQEEATKRNQAIALDAYKAQYGSLLKTLPGLNDEVAEKEAKRNAAKNALLALGAGASDDERKKALQAYEKAKSEAMGARNALSGTNKELRNLKTLAEKAKKMPLTEKELYEIRQKEMDAAKNLSNFWKKVLDDMTNVVKISKNAIDDIQINRIRSVIGGERRLPAMSRRDVSAYRERLFRAQTEDEAREIRMQYRREAILRNPSQGLGSTFAKAGVLKRYVNEAIVRDQREFMQLQKGLAERGGMMGPDERSRTLARMRELQDSITKGMETYIGVQGDLVKRQKEARNGILQLAQSLQKFRSVAVDAVDSLSSEAFSMRFRSFSGLKELPQMRETTAEERSMYGNMERKDAWGTMANEVMAAFAERYGEDAKKRYETAIKGLDAPANTFKTAAETFDRAVQRPLTVNVNAVDVFGGRP